jgi:hypothetical protein
MIGKTNQLFLLSIAMLCFVEGALVEAKKMMATI